MVDIRADVISGIDRSNFAKSLAMPAELRYNVNINPFHTLSAQYEDEKSMTAKPSEIQPKLLQKGELGADSLEIIGVVPEKKYGTQFLEDEAETMF